MTIDSEIHNTFALDIRFPQRRDNQFLFLPPSNVEYKKFSAALSLLLSPITKRGRKKKKGYDAVIWSHRSARRRKRNIWKELVIAECFYFIKRHFSSPFFFSGENTHTHAMHKKWVVYIYFSFQFCLRTTLSHIYSTEHSPYKNALFAALWRASLSACTKGLVRNGQVCVPLSMRKKMARTQN